MNKKKQPPATPEEIRRQRDAFLTKLAEVIRKNHSEDKKKPK